MQIVGLRLCPWEVVEYVVGEVWCGLICRRARHGLSCLHSFSVSTFHTPVFSLTLACIFVEGSGEEMRGCKEHNLECIRSCHKILWSLETGPGRERGVPVSALAMVGQLRRSTGREPCGGWWWNLELGLGP